MEKHFSLLKTSVFFLITILFSCHKTSPADSDTTITPHEILEITQADTTLSIPLPGMVQCNEGPAYEDSILFQQPTSSGQDYIIFPTNNPGTGTYLSWPKGMVIDKTSGAINVSKSETGVRFRVGFVKTGTTDTCMQTLILAGSSYMDSVYVSNSPEVNAAPYYNANPNSVSTCQNAGGCSFDIGDNAKKKGVEINKATGIISVSKSIKVFGRVPFNGEVILVPFNYSINDGSNNAIQQITIAMVYFDRKSNIPKNIMDYIQLKRANAQQPIVVDGSTNPRPPLIVITRYQ